MSPETWRRVPNTAAAIFGITIPYRPPTNRIGAFLWRKRMLLETTTGLVLLETWEKTLMLILIYLVLTFFVTGLYKFAPQYAVFVAQRTIYYLLGPESEGSAAAQAAGWVGRNVTGEL